MSETKTTEPTEPTWGYKRGGHKQLFNLAPGEKLPDGWSTKIPEGEHPHDAEQGRFPPKAEEPSQNPSGAASQDQPKGGSGKAA